MKFSHRLSHIHHFDCSFVLTLTHYVLSSHLLYHLDKYLVIKFPTMTLLLLFFQTLVRLRLFML